MAFFPREYISVFIPCFIGTICQNYVAKSGGSEKKTWSEWRVWWSLLNAMVTKQHSKIENKIHFYKFCFAAFLLFMEIFALLKHWKLFFLIPKIIQLDIFDNLQIFPKTKAFYSRCPMFNTSFTVFFLLICCFHIWVNNWFLNFW